MKLRRRTILEAGRLRRCVAMIRGKREFGMHAASFRHVLRKPHEVSVAVPMAVICDDSTESFMRALRRIVNDRTIMNDRTGGVL